MNEQSAPDEKYVMIFGCGSFVTLSRHRINLQGIAADPDGAAQDMPVVVVVVADPRPGQARWQKK